jgi:hypothetical protein
MAKVFDGIDERMRAWLDRQAMFFVGSAPLSADGHVNISPKGMRGTFQVIDEHTVAYLDLTGSGIETMAHLRENGRIVLMFCAFDGPPRIVRLWGRGTAYPAGSAEFGALLAGVRGAHPGARAVVRVAVSRVADSCGYAVPLMSLTDERDLLHRWAGRKDPDELERYRRDHNATSIDGLPGWPADPAGVPATPSATPGSRPSGEPRPAPVSRA